MTPRVIVKCPNCRAKTFFRTNKPLKSECTECGETIRVLPGSTSKRRLLVGASATAAIVIASAMAAYMSGGFSG